jgi:methylmalonyl-CoA mutase N-terminal domain/subunit
VDLRRNPEIHAAALRALEDTARNGANLMPLILTAVDALATVGEVADVLRGAFGEYSESVVV